MGARWSKAAPADPAEQARALLEKHGDEALIAAFEFEEGRTAYESAAPACVRAVLAGDPDTATVKQATGWDVGCTALAKAAKLMWQPAAGRYQGVELEVFEALLEANPAAASVQGGCYGCLPLHDAIRVAVHTGDTRVVEALLRAHPDAAKVADQYGNLPLHYAAGCNDNRTSLPVVKAVFEAYPGAATSSGQWKNFTPLHVAARASSENSAADVVQFLVQAHPDAAGIADEEFGFVPLHWALHVQHAPDLKTVKTLLAAYPAGAAAVAKLHVGMLPLHLAAQLKASPTEVQEVVDLLLAANPGAAQSADTSGALPLHYALEVGDSSTVSKALSKDVAEAGAIVAAWEEIRSKDKRSVLRLNGFAGVARRDIHSALLPFGQIEHLHHVQGTSSVTLAIFTSEDAARAAYTAHLDNKGEAQVQHGTPLYLPEASEAGFSFSTSMGMMREQKVIAAPGMRAEFSFGTSQKDGYFRYKDCGYEGYWDQLKCSVCATEKLLPSSADAAKDKTLAHFVDWCERAEARSAPVTEVADLQLQLCRALRLREDEDTQELVQMWSRTMQMIIDRSLSMQVDRFAVTILELLSFCDQESLVLQDVQFERE